MMRGWIVLCSVLCATVSLAEDWPTAAHDAARSGRTADVAPGPYRVRWAKAWQYENIATCAQLIVAQGRGYIGTLGRDGSLHGKVHCVDVQTGRDLWTYDDLYGGVAHALTWSPHAGGTVYAATTGGQLLAIEAASGKLRWKFETPLGGFVVNPCVIDGAVLAGSRLGVFYALNETDGSVRWERDVEIPICNTAAAANGTVYFLDEGLNTHALSIATGKPAEGWLPRQLYGGAARFYWPVIAGEQVLFGVAPPHRYDWERTDKVLFQVPGAKDRKTSDRYAIGTPEQEAQEQANIIAFLKDNPHNRVLHCLNRHDGRPSCLPGVLYTGGSGSECAPPVLTKDNRVIVEYRSFYSLWDSDSWHNPYSALGTLDTKTGIVTQLRPKLAENKRLPWGHIWIIADESSSFSTAGDTLFVSHQGNFGGVELATGQTFAGIGQRDTFGGYPPLSWNRQEWHGGPRSPLTIVDGTMYYVVGGRVIACEGNAQPGAKNADVEIVKAESGEPKAEEKAEKPKQFPDNAAIAQYLEEWKTRKTKTNEDLVAPLKKALNKQVASLIANEHNAPFHEWRGIGNSGLSMEPPEDTLRALGLSFRYLDYELRAQTLAYLEKRYSLTPRPAPPDLRRYGETRNFHRLDRDDFLRHWTMDFYHRLTPGGNYSRYLLLKNVKFQAKGPELWIARDRFPDIATTRYSDASQRIDYDTGRKIANQSRALNATFANVLATDLMDLPAPEDYRKQHVEKFRDQLDTVLDWHRHVGKSCAEHLDDTPATGKDPSASGQFRNQGGPYFGKTHEAAIVLWTDMSPEVGQLIKQYAPTETAAIKRWMLRNAQGCYLVRWDTPVQEGEVCAPWYLTTMNYYHLLATIDQPDFATMKLLVDMPACHGDVYYIERLARAIEASGRP